MKQILIAVDGSEHSLAAAKLAARFPKSELHALFIKDTTLINAPYWQDFGALALPTLRFDEELDRFFQTRGGAVLDGLRALYPNIDGRIETGRPDQIILEESEKFDIVAIGVAGESHEETGDNVHPGARFERIVRRIQVPLLVSPLKPTEFERFRFVISEISEKSVKLAINLARYFGFWIEFALIGLEGEEHLAPMREILHESGLSGVDPVVITGEPSVALREVVDTKDLIIVTGQDFDTWGTSVVAMAKPFLILPY